MGGVSGVRFPRESPNPPQKARSHASLQAWASLDGQDLEDQEKEWTSEYSCGLAGADPGPQLRRHLPPNFRKRSVPNDLYANMRRGTSAGFSLLRRCRDSPVPALGGSAAASSLSSSAPVPCLPAVPTVHTPARRRPAAASLSSLGAVMDEAQHIAWTTEGHLAESPDACR